jgi:small subunit ribosomal protein S1
MMENEISYNFDSFDEEWWAALMSDEGVQSPMKTEPAQQPIEEKKEKPQQMQNDWDFVNSLLDQDQVEICQVVASNRGGLLVRHEKFIGFVPVSHLIDENPLKNEAEREVLLKRYIGNKLDVKVIECEKKRGRIVLSERAAQSAPGQRQHLLETLMPHDHVRGPITNITDFGIFIDLGGVEGLAHISELSWGRVTHPNDLFKIGEEQDAMVLSVERDKGRVSLSVKRLLPNPWDTVLERYPRGKAFPVTVVQVVTFGAFVRLEEGLEGLIHISEMNLIEGDTPGDILSVGEMVMAEIVSADIQRQRLSLRLKD